MALKIENGTLKKYRPRKNETEIIIPDGVTCIGSNAFDECDVLESIVIPEGVITIEYEAFARCVNLKHVSLPRTLTTIGCRAFTQCTSLGSIELPDSVTAIGLEAFRRCSSLGSITIPDSVTELAEAAFRECEQLKRVTLGNGLTALAKNTFCGCENLQSITFGQSLAAIGSHAFAYCGSLAEIHLPASLREIGDHAFESCEGLTGIVIPDGVTHISTGAFFRCRALAEVRVPQILEHIGGSAFSETKWLAEYPDDLVIIGGILHQYKGKKRKVIVPDGVRKIGKLSFDLCTSVNTIILPDTVTCIESLAIYCEKLTQLHIGKGMERMEYACVNWGYSPAKRCVRLPVSVKEIDPQALPDDENTVLQIVLENDAVIEISVSRIRDAGESIQSVLTMLHSRSFSCKFSHKIKYHLILDYFFGTGEEKVRAYIGKNFVKIMEQLIAENDTDRIHKLLERTDFLTKKNIDKLIELAIAKKAIEIQTMLMHYKSEVLGYNDPAAEFRL